MEKLIFELDNLINVIENNNNVKKIKELNQKLQEDKDLIKLIEKYKETRSEKLKEEIISNKLFQEYKEVEIEVNLIIMNINNKLKEITSNKECSL